MSFGCVFFNFCYFLGEWWVHSRPHSSGHQLHYDSDETSLENGTKKPRHPVISVVVYVSGSNIGGPTLMTDQVLGGSLAEKGWMCFPGDNRILLFNANYLHGEFLLFLFCLLKLSYRTSRFLPILY